MVSDIASEPLTTDPESSSACGKLWWIKELICQIHKPMRETASKHEEFNYLSSAWIQKAMKNNLAVQKSFFGPCGSTWMIDRNYKSPEAVNCIIALMQEAFRSFQSSCAARKSTSNTRTVFNFLLVLNLIQFESNGHSGTILMEFIHCPFKCST